MRNISKLAAVAAFGMVLTLSGTAWAQADGDWKAARQAGLIGEQPDGYLGIVGNATPELRALVNNINMQRKSVYTKGAANGSTVEQFAFVAGCNQIKRLGVGEYYRTPDARWVKRDAGDPIRDSRCV